MCRIPFLLVGLIVIGGLSTDAQAVEVFFRPPRTIPIDWSTKTETIVRKLNDPNPYVVVEFLKYLETHGFEPKHFEQCRDYRWHTVEEILRSKSLDRERQYVLSFLNRFSKEMFEPNEQRWLRRLSSIKLIITV